MKTWWEFLVTIPRSLVIASVRAYQLFLSPVLGPNCRFTPTCSSYLIAAVRKYGTIRGTLRGIGRICRCHPFHKGGYDPP